MSILDDMLTEAAESVFVCRNRRGQYLGNDAQLVNQMQDARMFSRKDDAEDAIESYYHSCKDDIKNCKATRRNVRYRLHICPLKTMCKPTKAVNIPKSILED